MVSPFRVSNDLFDVVIKIPCIFLAVDSIRPASSNCLHSFMESFISGESNASLYSFSGLSCHL